MNDTGEELLSKAARAVAEADALFIAAGAGMGVDSGLPDFRGVTGFWRAYPPLARLGLGFEDIANPLWFRTDPHLAWGFYGHRLMLYRQRTPHAGYQILLRWAKAKPVGYFVFTSNVDRHFARAGFSEERIVECHGSIEHLQCVEPCTHDLWEALAEGIVVDEHTMRAADPLPHCPRCGELARPNILMFCDCHWVEDRTAAQRHRLDQWFNTVFHGGAKVAIIELGAGPTVPTVRWTCESLMRAVGAPLIRINLHDAEGPPGCISLAGGALAILEQLDSKLAAEGSR
ncbi:MAG: SIR2 family NAD-dependent protein deacylase [Candidatus Sumerlaeaceae bacterium]|jgi:NAD-dependent SIR2 family protein deacetylase